MDIGRKKIRLGDLLINNKSITQQQLQAALELQKGTGKKLGEVLVDEGFVSEEEIAKALSTQLGMELVDLNTISIDPNILNLVSPNVLKKDMVFPFEYANGNMNILRVAMADPMDMYAQDDISIITNCQVEPVVTTTRILTLVIDKYYVQDDVTVLEEYAKV